MRTLYNAVHNGLSTTEKHLIDLASVATVVGSLTDIFPHIAAGLTILWTGIRIWETDTIQKLLGNSKDKE